MDRKIKEYLASIGSKGGKKSTRRLSSVDAKKMVRVREAKRAFRTYKALCFWSFDPNFRITFDDIPWVVQQLRKYGNRESWEVASKLCR